MRIDLAKEITDDLEGISFHGAVGGEGLFGMFDRVVEKETLKRVIEYIP